MSVILDRLHAMGLELPAPHPHSNPNRTACVRSGNVFFVPPQIASPGLGAPCARPEPLLPHATSYPVRAHPHYPPLLPALSLSAVQCTYTDSRCPFVLWWCSLDVQRAAPRRGT